MRLCPQVYKNRDPFQIMEENKDRDEETQTKDIAWRFQILLYRGAYLRLYLF